MASGENRGNGATAGHAAVWGGSGGDTAPRAGSAGGDALRISWSEPRGFIWLSVKVFLLSALTLGIYYFWGKVVVRRRIWHAIRINDEPLEYTGTGGELLLGFLVGAVLLVAGVGAYAVLVFLLAGQGVLADLLSIPLYLALFWLMGLAVYRARRYRLRRSRWRGIRGTMSGSASSFATLWTWTGLLVPLSLGWALPWRQVKLARRLTDETRIGSAALRFTPEVGSGPLYPPFAFMWVMIVLTGLLVLGAGFSAVVAEDSTSMAMTVLAVLAGLLAVWLALRYHAIRLNWLAANTHLHDGRFILNFGASDLFRLVLGNALILLLSFGILLPVVQKRLVRHFVQSLDFVGTVDLAAIRQAGDALEKSGEGLAEVFDIDAF